MSQELQTGLLAVAIGLVVIGTTLWLVRFQVYTLPGIELSEHLTAPKHADRPSVPLSGISTLDVLVHLDSHLYLDIAAHGYSAHDHSSNVVFFPLLPWLMRSLHELTGCSLVLAGHLIVRLFLLTTVFLLACFTTRAWSDLTGDTGPGPRAVALLAVTGLLLHPGGIVLHTIYTESLFLTFFIGLFLALYLQRLFWLGICAFLVVLTRPSGLFIPVAFVAVDLWSTLRARRPRVRRDTLIVVGGGLLGLSLLATAQLLQAGSPFGFVSNRSYWDPDSSFWNLLKVFAPRISRMSLLQHFLLYMFIVGSLMIMRRGSRTLGLACLLLILMPLQQGHVGNMVRYSLWPLPALIPLFRWGVRRQPLPAVYLAISGALYGFHMQRWIFHMWVG